jgi:hypothetical protein
MWFVMDVNHQNRL